MQGLRMDAGLTELRDLIRAKSAARAMLTELSDLILFISIKKYRKHAQ
jgi:hypothetical protein